MANSASSLQVPRGVVSTSSGNGLLVLMRKGPGYRTDPVFDLSKMQPYNMMNLIGPFQELTEDIALYLPRTSNLRQLARAVKDDEKMTVVHYCMEGASKASSCGLLFYFLANIS